MIIYQIVLIILCTALTIALLDALRKIPSNDEIKNAEEESRAEAFAEVIDMLNEMADDTGATIQQSNILRSAAENVGRTR